jgi:hypothetical protein
VSWQGNVALCEPCEVGTIDSDNLDRSLRDALIVRSGMCTRLRCSGSWADHGQQTGGFYKCNRFMPAEVKTIVSAIDKAKADLDRYVAACANLQVV